MDDIEKLHYMYKLKEVERFTDVNNRKENSAEHSWGAMILALYFLKKVDRSIDESRVLKLLLYHDLVEIETGDVAELNATEEKAENERIGFINQLDKIPENLREEYKSCFNEYKSQETIEAKFAKAIDKIDSMIHCWNIRSDWKSKGYDEQTIIEKKFPYIEEFPEIKEYVEMIISHLKENKWL